MTIRIGIFSDVHGCIDELKQTVALLQSLQVDTMICAGDLVDKGLDSEGVIAFMQAQSIPCVQGNHDANAQYNWFTFREPLSESSLEYLISLPLELTFEWAGVQVYLSHSNPWQDSSIYVYPSRPPALFEEITSAVTAQVLVLGHTHIPMCVQHGEKFIINPGAIYGNASSESVYTRRDTDQRTCGILTLPHPTFELYNIQTGARASLL